MYVYPCLAAITGAIVDNRRSRFPGKEKGRIQEHGAFSSETGKSWIDRGIYVRGAR